MKAGTRARLSSRQWDEVYRHCVKEISVKVICAVLYILIKRGWHKENLKKLWDDIYALYTMPEILGHSLKDTDVVPYVSKYIGLTVKDWERLQDGIKVVVDNE